MSVHAFQIIGTQHSIVEAWEPYAGHSTMRHTDEGWLGQVTARPLPVAIEVMLPGSAERMSAAIDWHAANVTDALAMIDAAFPALLERDDVRLSGGRVEWEGSLPVAEELVG